MAGVEYVLVSLWSVPDTETMELMTAFYRGIARTNDIVASFDAAQREMRVKYPDRPESWAGFVLVR
jgi:CHAT domain-containing protein